MLLFAACGLAFGDPDAISGNAGGGDSAASQLITATRTQGGVLPAADACALFTADVVNGQVERGTERNLLTSAGAAVVYQAIDAARRGASRDLHASNCQPNLLSISAPAKTWETDFYTANVVYMATEPVRLTLQEYLTWELSQETRHEYVHGLVLAMSGASRSHGTIVMNLSAFIKPKLRASACDAFASDMKVIAPNQKSCRYPDFLVTCDERDKVDLYVTRHPKLIVEVVSSSSERIDRVEKLDEYATIPELDEYVLIYSQRPAVEIYRRGLDKSLSMIFRHGPGDEVYFASLDLRVPMNLIYEGIDFEKIAQYQGRE